MYHALLAKAWCTQRTIMKILPDACNQSQTPAQTQHQGRWEHQHQYWQEPHNHQKTLHLLSLSSLLTALRQVLVLNRL